MNITIDASVLSSGLQLLKPVSKGRHALPILECVSIEISNSGILLSATGLEVYVQKEVEAIVDEPGAICVNLELLEKLSSKLSGQIQLITDGESKVVVMSDTGDYELPVFDIDDFPSPPEAELGQLYNLDPGSVRAALTRCVKALFDDATLDPKLAGVYFDSENRCIAGTDRHRISVSEIDGLTTDHVDPFICTAKTAEMVRRANSDTLGIIVSEEHVIFDCEDVIITGRLVNGDYPNYRAVMPRNNTKEAIVDTKRLLDGIDRVALFSNDAYSNRIEFRFDGNELKVVGEDQDKSRGAHEDIVCDSYSGDPIEIGFSEKYMKDALRLIGTDLVRIEMNLPSTGVLITPVDSIDEYEIVVMPLAK